MRLSVIGLLIAQWWYWLELCSYAASIWMQRVQINITKAAQTFSMLAKFSWRAPLCFYAPAERIRSTVVWISHTYCLCIQLGNNIIIQPWSLESIKMLRYNSVITSHNPFHVELITSVCTVALTAQMQVNRTKSDGGEIITNTSLSKRAFIFDCQFATCSQRQG